MACAHASLRRSGGTLSQRCRDLVAKSGHIIYHNVTDDGRIDEVVGVDHEIADMDDAPRIGDPRCELGLLLEHLIDGLADDGEFPLDGGADEPSGSNCSSVHEETAAVAASQAARMSIRYILTSRRGINGFPALLDG